jgi:hypothetical protein
MSKLPRRPLPIALAGIGLFAALGGVATAANGGPWILGQSNSATATTALSAPVDGPGVQIANSSTGVNSTPLRLTAAAGRPPLKVNSVTKVANLNADQLDNIDSTSFLRRAMPTSFDASGAGGVLDVTNTGSSNGVQGKATQDASGVYGEHIGTGGFGIAGRAGDDGKAVYGDNIGTGWAGYFEQKVHIGGALDCNGCVSAADVDTVNGSDVSGKVANADALDGIDSTGFMQGNGGSVGQAIAMVPGAHPLFNTMFDFLQLQYDCPTNINNNGNLIIWNRSAGNINVFVESRSTPPLYFDVAPNGPATLPSTASGDMFHISAQGVGIMTVEVASVHRVSRNDCHMQEQATFTR